MAYLTFLRVHQCVGLRLPSPAKSKRHRQHRRTALATAETALRGSAAITFNTDGIPFIVDNSATCNIANDWSLFPGNLVLVQVHVDIIDTSKSRQQYWVTICLKLVNDANINHIYNIPNTIYDPASNFNLLRIPKLAEYFKNRNSLPGKDVDSDGTTIKSSSCCSCFIWDHGRHMRNFTHRDYALLEILLYQGNGYFSAFCLWVQWKYDNKIAFAFSSSFSISPQSQEDAALVLDNDNSEDKDMVSMTCNTGYATPQPVSHPLNKVEWYEPPPPPPENLPHPLPITTPPISPPSNSFKLGMSLVFSDGASCNDTVVYKGVMPDGLTHTVWQQDGTRLNVRNALLHLKPQADLTNIPCRPLNYCKEVGKEISKEGGEAEALACPQILAPVQQELMDCHHCLYHFFFPKIFRLAEKGYLPKGLMKCKNFLPLCIACQFRTAHHPP
jgi:hypothetical protein